MSARRQRRKLTREEYAKGLPDYHDPTARLSGMPPMYSALTMRLWVSSFGIVFCVVVGLLWLRVEGMLWLSIALFAIAAGLLVNFGWVLHRKRRGEPG